MTRFSTGSLAASSIRTSRLTIDAAIGAIGATPCHACVLMTTLDVVFSLVGRICRGIDDPLHRGALVWERPETLFSGVLSGRGGHSRRMQAKCHSRHVCMDALSL